MTTTTKLCFQRQQVVAGACLLLVVLLTSFCPVLSYNDDKPIYKWNPYWLSGFKDGFNIKRYNDDKPIYKWHPIWFIRNGYNKRDFSMQSQCVPEFGSCVPRSNQYSAFQCCPGMECFTIDLQSFCFTRLDEPGIDDYDKTAKLK